MEQFANLMYLVASALFIFGIKGLTHPRTAVRGNLLGALGMALAMAVTILLKWDAGFTAYALIISGFVVGGLIGWQLAWKVEMTAMPELVALYNGFGGGASFLVAGIALLLHGDYITDPVTYHHLVNMKLEMDGLIATYASGIIGAVTLTGSVMAFCKLREYKWVPNGFLFQGQNLANIAILLLAILLSGLGCYYSASLWPYWVVVLISCVLGVMLVVAIGGADMPVVIALLNSYSGLAAAATGFVIDNNILIIAGSLVGASGVILTGIMCKAMNRSLSNVLFGGLLSEQASAGPSADDVYGGKVKSTTPEEVAMLFDTAQRVVIVPGYGVAVAQAQHAVRDLENLLESRGVTVEYAIHPVAGRMPGHMNVLLAEADVPYEKLIEMDAINPTMSTVDICMVIGANDVVNPDARKSVGPLAGMPIINVDEARMVIVVKRSLSPGFAGVPNPLFAMDNAQMMFGDGKKAIIELTNCLKEG
ncbi:NAD(P)(+) transhydrogenase (Re/Si-specific) subunit beta [Candidatus Sumerlaeota bacterium]|nr:NAD(P)(+) transhydrogenase (Re/Si-specific) subunit beta [Candidatus Sumerlaeota bacterium]